MSFIDEDAIDNICDQKLVHFAQGENAAEARDRPRKSIG